MTKTKIPVLGDKELIERLNERIKEIKTGEASSTQEPVDVSEPQDDHECETQCPITTAASAVEDTETVEPACICDSSENHCPTFVEYFDEFVRERKQAIKEEVEEESDDTCKEDKDFSDIESDRQRCLKYNNYNIPTNTNENSKHATAYPLNVSPEIVLLIEEYGPKMAELLGRISGLELEKPLDDNTQCRNAINKEYDYNKHEPSESLKKIISSSKKLAEELKNYKGNSNICNRIASIKEACKKAADNNNNNNNAVENKSYEMVDHPKHYNTYDIETIDMMLRIWGPEATALWCTMTAFKYRMRMGTKPTSPVAEDLKKETWYINKANEIKSNINTYIKN
jgi:hypothetical protein